MWIVDIADNLKQSLILMPSVLFIPVAVCIGLFRIRKKGTEEKEERIYAALLGMWAVWHFVFGAYCILKYGEYQTPISEGAYYSYYHITFSIFGWMTLLGALLCLRSASWRKDVPAWMLFFVGLLLWSVLCTLSADHPKELWVGTYYRTEGLRSIFFYAAIFLCAARLRNGKRKLLGLFALAANYQAILILFQAFSVPWVMNFSLNAKAGNFFNENHVAYYLTMSILVLSGLYLYEMRRKYRIAYILSFGVQYFALLKNDTFGCILAVWVGIFVVYALFFLCRKSRLPDYAPVVLILAVSGTCNSSIADDFNALIGGIGEIIEDPTSLEAARAGSGRFMIWKETVKLIGQRPLLGWGPEGFSYELNALTGLDRPHNEYLQYTAFFGIPGLCLYLGGLVSLCVKRLKSLFSLDEATLVAGGAVMGYLISAFFGNTMFYTSPLFFLLLGLVASETVDANEDETLCEVDSPA